MKKMLLISGIFLSYASMLCAQEEVNFKVRYKPEYRYEMTTEQKSETVMKYIGSKELLNTLKEKGIENPTVTNTKSVVKSVFETGKLTDGKHFPVRLEFIETQSSDGKKSIPDHTVILGTEALDSLPRLDSIVSDRMDPELKKSMLAMIQATFLQLAFPDKKLKTGKSFSTESPVSLPLPGMSLDMIIKTNYRLVKVSAGLATFDIVQTYTMNTTIKDIKGKASGAGKGKMVYDTNTGFYTLSTIDLTMQMLMSFDKFDIDAKITSIYEQTVVVTKNENAGK